ncbi:MAG: adenylate/guanylate cyclase domain-containing protein [Micromonosporaceae bacterium]
MEEQRALLAELETVLLSGEPCYTRHQVAELAGVPLERAEALWRALGFAAVGDDDVVFNDYDVEAVRLISSLVQLGVVQPRTELALSRSLGQSMSRLAEWQTQLVRDVLADPEGAPREGTAEAVAALVPVIERLQSHVWRRHLLAAAVRMLASPTDDPDSATLVVGFADIVSFTRLSRSISDAELAEFIEHFEGTAATIIAERRGRVIKTIGDEVLFVADLTTDAAAIAVELAHRIDTDEEFPRLRVGMAYGPVLSRLGDVYGPVVNIAARLTSLARPGTVLIDRALREALTDVPGYRLRRTPRAAVHGYTRLEPWVLRPGEEGGPPSDDAAAGDAAGGRSATGSDGESGDDAPRRSRRRRTR